jgi:hypothetical protein
LVSLVNIVASIVSLSPRQIGLAVIFRKHSYWSHLSSVEPYGFCG